MAGELDGVVDSLSSSSPQSQAVNRMTAGEAFTARGDSPGVAMSETDYHTDQHIDRRESFAKSVNDDGGLSMLEGVNERGQSTREALLAADQSDVQGSVAMKPRKFEAQRGQNRAKRGSGAIMSSEEMGLGMQPIKIQRQADVTDQGIPIDPEGAKPQTFLSDGTSAGGKKIDRAGGVSEEEVAQAKTAAATATAQAAATPSGSPKMQPAVPGQGAQVASDMVMPTPPTIPSTVQAAPAPAAKPAKRVIFHPHGGGKIRTRVSDAIIGPKVIILTFDADADSYEPAAAQSDTPIGVEIDGKTYKCIYGEWSAETDASLYLVFVIVGAPASS